MYESQSENRQNVVVTGECTLNGHIRSDLKDPSPSRRCCCNSRLALATMRRMGLYRPNPNWWSRRLETLSTKNPVKTVSDACLLTHINNEHWQVNVF